MYQKHEWRDIVVNGDVVTGTVLVTSTSGVYEKMYTLSLSQDLPVGWINASESGKKNSLRGLLRDLVINSATEWENTQAETVQVIPLSGEEVFS